MWRLVWLETTEQTHWILDASFSNFVTSLWKSSALNKLLIKKQPKLKNSIYLKVRKTYPVEVPFASLFITSNVGQLYIIIEGFGPFSPTAMCGSVGFF